MEDKYLESFITDIVSEEFFHSVIVRKYGDTLQDLRSLTSSDWRRMKTEEDAVAGKINRLKRMINYYFLYNRDKKCGGYFVDRDSILKTCGERFTNYMDTIHYEESEEEDEQKVM